MSSRHEALALVAALVLGGCGLHPLYAGGEAGQIVPVLNTIAVENVIDQSAPDLRGRNVDVYANTAEPPPPRAANNHVSRLAQLMQDGLTRVFTAQAAPAYRLRVLINENIESFGIRRDESFTRQRLILAAHYELVDANSQAVVMQGEATSDVGIDRVGSEYATVVGERTADSRNAEQLVRDITTRVALFMKRQQP